MGGPLILHLGCGRTRMDGAINVDISPLPSVDVVADVCALPFEDNSADKLIANHLLEHLSEPLKVMAEWWRVAKPDALCQIRIPYGSSDNAWEDPTHQRPYFLQSFGYFSMPFYHRSAPYGNYKADWQPDVIRLLISKQEIKGDMPSRVHKERNLVREMVVDLRCVKPARANDKALIEQPRVEIHGV